MWAPFNFPWETLSVTLPEKNDTVEEGDQQEELNHKNMAMFVGLQVLDGSQFRVETKNNAKYMVPCNNDDTTAGGKKRKVNKERTESSSNNKDSNSSKKKKKRKTEEKAPNHNRTQGHVTDDSTKALIPPHDEQRSIENDKQNKKKRKKRKEEGVTDSSYGVNRLRAQEHQQVNRIETAVSEQPQQEEDDTLQQQIQELQTSWMMACGGGVVLHSDLCQSLLQQKFSQPTPIQASTLGPSILGRHNVVGVAPTGSGKTLAYLLPILQSLLQEEEQEAPMVRSWRALVLVPTRELANQITKECHKLLKEEKRTWVGTLVGGLAEAKQSRILNVWKPPILVATPGRLYNLMSSGEYPHLQDLSRFQFLVVDEVDRMFHQGKHDFPQLYKILEELQRQEEQELSQLQGEHVKEGENDDLVNENYDESDDDEEGERMMGLPGIRGEAKVTMLSREMLDLIEKQQQRHESNDGNSRKDATKRETSYMHKQSKRQTFVFSATMSLPSIIRSDGEGNKKKTDSSRKKNRKQEVEGAIAEILEIAQAKGPTKIVNLTTASSPTGASLKSTHQVGSSSSPAKLPPGLSLEVLHVTQRHKDSYLYAYLVTTRQGMSGPCLVFCNSIAAVRRVGSTLQTLKVPVRMLHAQMTQKARFKAVESLNQPKSRAIVVATDVAARGLDIPSVATVVHYDAARTPDTFIHRAGRTARGVGEGAVGCSLSLVAPAEAKTHENTCQALGSKSLWQTSRLDGRLLSQAQERTALACKIVLYEDEETKTQKHNSWLKQAASDAGLDVDDELMEEGLEGGSKRERQQIKEAQQAKIRLEHLLTMPMQAERYGKFLSSNSAALETSVVPNVVAEPSNPKRKRRKKTA